MPSVRYSAAAVDALSFYDAQFEISGLLLGLSLGERGWVQYGSWQNWDRVRKLLLIVYRLHSIYSIKSRAHETCIKGGKRALNRLSPKTFQNQIILHLILVYYNLQTQPTYGPSGKRWLSSCTDGSLVLVTGLVCLYVTDSRVFFAKLTHSWIWRRCWWCGMRGPRGPGSYY